MRYYMIRHKASGEFMPEVKRRGYSHWNPATNSLPMTITGVPRIFASRKSAIKSIAQWNALPNAQMGYKQGYDGQEDYDLDVKPDGRKKEDLEIVAVDIVEVKE